MSSDVRTISGEQLLMIAWSGWKFPFMKIARLRRIVRVEPGVIDAIGEHNRSDIELYDFGKKLF